jgi:hypothetical protein
MSLLLTLMIGKNSQHWSSRISKNGSLHICFPLWSTHFILTQKNNDLKSRKTGEGKLVQIPEETYEKTDNNIKIDLARNVVQGCCLQTHQNYHAIHTVPNLLHLK